MVDVVAYPAVPEGLDVELAEFAERSWVDSRAFRLLRVVTRVDPVEAARAPEAKIVFAAAADSSVDQVVAAIHAETDWPVIYAPAPAPADIAPAHPDDVG